MSYIYSRAAALKGKEVYQFIGFNFVTCHIKKYLELIIVGERRGVEKAYSFTIKTNSGWKKKVY
jgi:hypothetical protein